MRPDVARRQVIVIGAGMSGLSVAFWLRQRGIEVTVLERAPRVGGVIRSERVGGYMIDHAANCLMNFLPEVNHLCEMVGLADQRMFRSENAGRRYLLKNGRPESVPLTPREMLVSPFWSRRAKLRKAVEPFIPASGSEAEESVAGFARRRFGRELFEQAIDPFVAGTLGGDPELACVRSTMPRFQEFEQRFGSVLRGVLATRLAGSVTCCPARLFSSRGGMEALPAAIGRYLGSRIRTDAEPESIERRGDRWLVEVVSGSAHASREAVSHRGSERIMAG